MKKMVQMLMVLATVFLGILVSGTSMAQDSQEWLKTIHRQQRLNEQRQIYYQQKRLDQMRNSNASNYYIRQNQNQLRMLQQNHLNQEWLRQSIEIQNRRR